MKIVKWLSAVDVDTKIINKTTDQEVLFEAYALSLFTDHALYCAEFTPSEAWAEMVVPTDSGREILQALDNAGHRFSRHVQLFTLFRLFYHRDLLIDHHTTDIEGILGLLRSIHAKAQAQWPYVFGNRLYNKFNDTYNKNQTDSLEAKDSHVLLSGTSQGVFQVGNIVSGPLGFLHSEEKRTLPPTLRLPLWHCSDPGCQARHSVRLEQHKNECWQALTTYIRYIVDTWGPPSEWHKPIFFIYRRDRWTNGRPYNDLPAVIGDCLIGPERTTLCLHALRSPHNRQLITALREANRSTGKPEEVASDLTPEEQHQLLLLLPDKDIIHMIDEIVCQREIRIPPSELRLSKTYAYGQSSDFESQFSSLGIRSTKHSALIELSALIWNTYEALRISDELLWRVRGHAGTTLRHSVVDFVRLHGPEAAVRELILPSRDVTKSIAESLTFSVRTNESEDLTCSRLLWKLGFNTARYEDEYVLLRDRIAKFRKQVLQMSPDPSEDERASVRSCGVNLFVSVEQFLENMLCYNVWLMASDHFTGTKFQYTKQDALITVGQALGMEIQSGDETIHWATDGTNTIGALLAYFNAFRTWLKGRSDADKSDVKRREADYPHYAKDTLLVFPFEHKQLWADTTPEIMAAYMDLLDKMAVQIAQSELTAVRNGLDHKREDNAFPSSDTMLACVSRLQQVVDMADSKRLLPKLYWCIKSEQDADGNVCDTFADYRGSTHSLWTPSPVCAAPKKMFITPYIIAPFDFLNQPNSIMIFLVSPKTEYREYWKDYPRRRIIPPENNTRDETGIGIENGNGEL